MITENEITVAELKKARYALGDKIEALAREFEQAHGILIAEIEVARVQYFDGMHGKEKLSVCVRLDV
jgi:hypothetical protein